MRPFELEPSCLERRPRSSRTTSTTTPASASPPIPVGGASDLASRASERRLLLRCRIVRATGTTRNMVEMAHPAVDHRLGQRLARRARQVRDDSLPAGTSEVRDDCARRPPFSTGADGDGTATRRFGVGSDRPSRRDGRLAPRPTRPGTRQIMRLPRARRRAPRSAALLAGATGARLRRT
jgi:hypothetical protein